jgi:hypothetical protein
MRVHEASLQYTPTLWEVGFRTTDTPAKVIEYMKDPNEAHPMNEVFYVILLSTKTKRANHFRHPQRRELVHGHAAALVQDPDEKDWVLFSQGLSADGPSQMKTTRYDTLEAAKADTKSYESALEYRMTADQARAAINTGFSISESTYDPLGLVFDNCTTASMRIINAGGAGMRAGSLSIPVCAGGAIFNLPWPNNPTMTYFENARDGHGTAMTWGGTNMKVISIFILAAFLLLSAYYASFYLGGRSAISRSVAEAREAGLLVARYRVEDGGKREALVFKEVWVERQSHWERQGVFIRRLPGDGFRLVVVLKDSPPGRSFFRIPGSSHTMSMLSAGRWHYQDIDNALSARFQLEMQDYAVSARNAQLFSFECALN